MTSIEWTDRTWNPVIGCARVSAGCEHCYAETMAPRVALAQGRESPYLRVVDVERRRWNRRAVFLPERLGEPLRWKKPCRVFVNSMSDLFHEDLTFDQIAAVFGVMAATPRHTFQVLTKRPERMLEFLQWLRLEASGLGDIWGEVTEFDLCVAWARERGVEFDPDLQTWPLPNVRLGVSVEDQRSADERIPLLLQCPAALRFLSVEPLLSPVDLTHLDADRGGHKEFCQIDALTGRHTDMGRPCRDVEHVDWVIVGGESGPGARPCDVSWIASVVRQCREAGVPVFVKQLGAPWVNW